MANNNEIKAKIKGRANKSSLIILAVIIIALLIIGIIIYASITANKSESISSESTAGYTDLQTADDDFSAIEEVLNYLE